METNGGPLWAVPELVFEGRKLIPAVQQLLIEYHTLQNTGPGDKGDGIIIYCDCYATKCIIQSKI